jgi:hypothetical protein
MQKEKIEKMLELIKNNPNLRIIPQVNTECVPSDDWGWWISDWGDLCIDYITTRDGDERVYIKSMDYDELIDEYYDNCDNVAASDEEAYNQAKKKVDGLIWEEVILLEINPI